MEENPVQPSSVQNEPALQQPTDTPPPEKPSRFTKKRILIVIGIVIAIFLLVSAISGAYWYGKTSVQATEETKTTFMENNSPSLTPNPTADWETYLNSENGYSIKYPKSEFVRLICPDEELTLIIRSENDKRDTINMPSCSRGGRYALEIVTNPELIVPISDDFITITSKDIIVNNIPAVSYTSVVNEGIVGQFPSGTTWEEIIIQNGSNNYSIHYSLSEINKTLRDEIFSTFKFTDSDNIGVDTAGWKTSNSWIGNYSVQYPPDWHVEDTIFDELLEIKDIKSEDYVDSDSGPGIGPRTIKNGFFLNIRTQKNDAFNNYEDYKEFLLVKNELDHFRTDNNEEINVAKTKCLSYENIEWIGGYMSGCSMYHGGNTIDVTFRSVNIDDFLFDQILSTFNFTE